MGPSDRTLRDPKHPRSWRGVTAADRAVLVAWLTRPNVEVVTLHTDVPVGSLPAGFVPSDNQVSDVHAEAVYCRRIDALVELPGIRYVVEVKPEATPQALGQVLTYGNDLRDLGGLWGDAALCVCCQYICETMRGVYQRYGVAVVTVGMVLDE